MERYFTIRIALLANDEQSADAALQAALKSLNSVDGVLAESPRGTVEPTWRQTQFGADGGGMGGMANRDIVEVELD